MFKQTWKYSGDGTGNCNYIKVEIINAFSGVHSFQNFYELSLKSERIQAIKFNVKTLVYCLGANVHEFQMSFKNWMPLR